MNQSLDTAIKSTYALRGSVAKMNSTSWYKDRPEQILHGELNCFTDALSHSKTERTWIVYFRVIKKTDEDGNTYYELESLGRAKVGKGYFESGLIQRSFRAGCVGARSGSNPGPLGSEPSALTNCASFPLV